MAFLRPADAARVKQRFDDELVGDVRLLAFIQPTTGLFVPGRSETDSGRQTEALLREVAGLSDHVHVEVVNPREDPVRASLHGVERFPAIVVQSLEADTETGSEVTEEPGRIRFFGLPSGYEFMTLLDTVVNASQPDTRLTPSSVGLLDAITEPVHLQVFVTPT